MTKEINNQDIKNILINLLHLEHLVSELREKWEEEPLSHDSIKEILDLIKKQISNLKNANINNDSNHATAKYKTFLIAEKEKLFEDHKNMAILLQNQLEGFNSEFFDIYIESDPEISSALHEEFKRALDEITKDRKQTPKLSR